MKHFLFLFLLLYSTICYSQTDYYRYNSNGVPEKIGYSKPSNTNHYAPYRGVDLNLYEKVGRYKQNIYNDRLEILESKAASCYKLLKRFPKSDIEYYNNTIAIYNRLIKLMRELDLTDNELYYNCAKLFDSLETECLDTIQNN